MGEKTLHLVECLVADVTLVRLLPGVREPVVLVVPLLVEPLAAELAYPGPVPLVDPHVGVEGGASVEGLSARLALVRLLVRVDDLVAAERRGLAEALATHFTDEGSRACEIRNVNLVTLFNINTTFELGASA